MARYEQERESKTSPRAIKLAAVWDYRKQGHVSGHPASIYKMFFLRQITGGMARPSNETSEVSFAREALPPLSPGRVPDGVQSGFGIHHYASLRRSVSTPAIRSGIQSPQPAASAALCRCRRTDRASGTPE